MGQTSAKLIHSVRNIQHSFDGGFARLREEDSVSLLGHEDREEGRGGGRVSRFLRLLHTHPRLKQTLIKVISRRKRKARKRDECPRHGPPFRRESRKEFMKRAEQLIDEDGEEEVVRSLILQTLYVSNNNSTVKESSFICRFLVRRMDDMQCVLHRMREGSVDLDGAHDEIMDEVVRCFEVLSCMGESDEDLSIPSSSSFPPSGSDVIDYLHWMQFPHSVGSHDNRRTRLLLVRYFVAILLSLIGLEAVSLVGAPNDISEHREQVRDCVDAFRISSFFLPSSHPSRSLPALPLLQAARLQPLNAAFLRKRALKVWDPRRSPLKESERKLLTEKDHEMDDRIRRAWADSV